MGVDVRHNIGAFAAGIAFIPDINAGSNATNWTANNITIYRCTGTNTGQEFIYAGYNNQVPQSGFYPPQLIDCVIARNSCDRSGRDSYQPGGCINLRMHDNIGLNWGIDQSKDQESFITVNGGCSGIIYNNIGIGGKMHINLQSGAKPWNIFAGETTPQPLYIVSNYIDNGSYAAGGYAEPFSWYGQTYNGSGTGVYNFHIIHNTIISDKKIFEFYCQPNGFNISGSTFANNIIRRVGASAGDYPEFNIIENGYTLSNILVNNLVRTFGAEGDIMFTNLAAKDVTISSFSSTAYGATSDLTTRLSSITDYFNDLKGYPLIAPSYNPTFGAYSGYEKRALIPAAGDTVPATFTTPVNITSLTQSGGTLGYESNKQGILYYIVSTVDVYPTKTQIRAGQNHLGNPALISGYIIDIGTVTSKIITGGNESTNYYLFCVFVTTNNIEQTSATRVAYTTTADVTAPTLSTFTISDTQRSRVYFNSSETITGTTFSNFTISGKTISNVTINSGQITGHYFTVSTAFNATEVPTIQYSGGNNFKDTSIAQNSLAAFGVTSITNSIVPAVSEVWIAGILQNASITSGRALSTGVGGIETSKYIPANSHGYIEFGYESAMQGGFTDFRIGFTLDATTYTYSAAQLLVNAHFLTSGNTGAYEGNTYRDVQGGLHVTSNLFRFRVNRNTNNIYFEWSTNNRASWNELWNYGPIGAGALRGAISFGVSGKAVPSLKIQADNGLV